MAVKPITNPNPISPDNVDRSKQVSRKGDTIRNTNEQTSFVPGVDYTKDYQIVLQDLDKSVMSHVKNVMKPQIVSNGSLVNVPLLYGNQERWANIQTNGVIRDENGVLQLPLMMFRRSSVDFNESLPSWKHDVTGEFVSVVRSSKWSKDNQYTQFAVQQGVKPVEENIVTTVPQYVNTNYDFIVQTHYIEQMNGVIEAFVAQSNTYWGDNTSYRFMTTIDGGLADATEMEVAGERIIKSTFSVQLKGYLLPQTISNIVQNKKFTSKKQITPSRITFSEKIE